MYVGGGSRAEIQELPFIPTGIYPLVYTGLIPGLMCLLFIFNCVSMWHGYSLQLGKLGRGLGLS